MPDILIAPQRGTSNNPQIFFTGSVQTSASIRMEVLPEGQIAFLGKSGSLFSISDSMVGSLMAVSDISGLPILEVFSDDKVVMGKYNSNALVVTGSSVSIGKSVPNAKLDVNGNTIITGSANDVLTIYRSTVAAARIACINTFGTGWAGVSGAGMVLGGQAGMATTIYGGGTASLAIDINGNTAIGKATPINGRLDVSGSAIITGSLSINGDVMADNVFNPFLLMGA